MDIKLYVGNLADSTTENALRRLFSQAGKVTTVSLVKDRSNGQSEGFAFVTMAAGAGAQRAIATFHDFPLSGRRLTVNIAEQPKAPAVYQSRLGAFSVTSRSPRVNTLAPGKPGDVYQSKLSAFGNCNRSPTLPRRRGTSQRHQ